MSDNMPSLMTLSTPHSPNPIDLRRVARIRITGIRSPGAMN